MTLNRLGSYGAKQVQAWLLLAAAYFWLTCITWLPITAAVLLHSPCRLWGDVVVWGSKNMVDSIEECSKSCENYVSTDPEEKAECNGAFTPSFVIHRLL